MSAHPLEGGSFVTNAIAGDPAPGPVQYAGGSVRWFALAVLCTAFFMGVLDSTSVLAALPSIAEDLSFSPSGIQWVITAYGVTLGGLLLLGGRIADLFGRRRVS
jgi:MFS family permease